MKKSLLLVLGLLAALMLAPAANADVTTIFDGQLSCTVGGDDYRHCGSPSAATTVTSFDGTPIDVYVVLPEAPGSGSDGNFPVMGSFHGWAGSKVNLDTDPLAQQLLAQGIAVFTMTDRGWGSSCGGPASGGQGSALKDPPCADGYIHLMHNAAEVRDAQELLGQLADDRNDDDDAFVINSEKIGAAGGSYGGAISEALAMLKNRVQLPDGSLTAWESPDGREMAIAAAAPQYTWSDLAQSLIPNGSTLDYAADNPYAGPNGDRRNGIPKTNWIGTLYGSGAFLGYYAPAGQDLGADMISWNNALGTGGPYDTPELNALRDEITGNHSSYYIPIDDVDQQPAPMLISSSWNDDLFPVNEAVRLYNKVRAVTPSTPIVLWGVDIGHTPRANNDGPSRAADATPLIGNQTVWMLRYLKGVAAPFPVPVNPVGGVITTSSKCGVAPNDETRVAGTIAVHANWASMASGEVSLSDLSTRTIQPNTLPSSNFQTGSTTVCSYSSDTDVTAGAAVYESAAADSDWTVIGSPSVDATFDVTGANDAVVARLYDHDVAGDHLRLISRAIYRPLNPGGGPTAQTFQMWPQNYTVEAGHKLRLELLSADATFAQKANGQKEMAVSNLRLAVPVAEAADGQQIGEISPKTLPAGYQMTADVLATDTLAPSTTDDVPATVQNAPVSVTLSATDRGISGVDKTYYAVGANPTADTSSAVYDPNNKPQLGDGEKIAYFSVDRAGNEETPHRLSAAAQVDTTPPATPLLSSGPGAKISTNKTTIAFSSPEIGVSFRCSFDGAAVSACASPVELTGLSVGSHRFEVWAVDAVGNQSTAPLTVSFTVSTKISLKLKLSGKAKVGRTLKAKLTAKAFGKKLTKVKYSYSWTAGKKKVGKKSSLKLKKQWRGKRIALKVTAKKAGYKSATAKKTAAKKLKR